MSENLQKVLFREIVSFSEPLKTATTSDQALKDFFLEMGWNIDDALGVPLGNVKAVVSEISKLAATIDGIINKEEIESIGQVLKILNSIQPLFEKIKAIPASFGGVINPVQAKEVMEEIPYYLLARYLEKKHETFCNLLRLASIIENKEIKEILSNPPGKIYREKIKLWVFSFTNLDAFLKDPKKAIKKFYNESLDLGSVPEAEKFVERLFPILADLAKSLNAIYSQYEDMTGELAALAKKGITLKWKNKSGGTEFEVKMLLQSQGGGKFSWVIIPTGKLAINENRGGYGITATSDPKVKTLKINEKGVISYEASPPVNKVNGNLVAIKTGSPSIIGDAKGTRLEFGKISIGSSFDATTTKLNFDVNLRVQEGKFVISGAGQDGFIAKILPEKGVEVPFDLLIGYSTLKSLYLGANSGLELNLPVHINALGVLNIKNLALKLIPASNGLTAEAAVSGEAKLGPLTISFDEIGLKSNLDFKADTKNIGFANMNVGLKPPSGLGISLDAGPVSGGGFLRFNPEKEEYSGALELTIAGFISAKAIGLVTTKMPDGSKGFSMLIMITAEFSPPFQLGYGFTLLGVGGLLGLNRTVLLDPLRDGVRTGAVDNMLFPKNVIANAPRIISDLKTIFPTYEGRFLVGPMGKMGWGTPTLISLSLGIIVEIPGNFAILGVLKIVLPDDKFALIKIQVAFVGTIDFDKKMLTFDASLFESSIIGMTLEGDMAVRLKWGDQPDFVITVGGFHPAYNPPPLALPTLRRLAINILNTSIAKIRIECYQAVTSNTVQFGARADIFFDLAACSIKGYISFNALFQFSPFYFIVDVSAGFSLRALGVDLLSVRVKMSLEGPTPWRARGTGSVTILFAKVSADFDKTWGAKKETGLRDIEILPVVLAELKKKELWSSHLASNKKLLVTLRNFNETEKTDLILHPIGSLSVLQKIVPLKILIDKVGNQKLKDIKKLEITGANSGSIPFTVSEMKENFAPAQFIKLKDAEKLSKPSFEKLPAGVAISMGANPTKAGKMVRKIVQYEQTTIDKNPFKLILLEYSLFFTMQLNGASVAQSSLSNFVLLQKEPFKEKIEVMEDGYAVALLSNNKAFNNQSIFASEAMAASFMKEQIIKNPELGKEIHIVPTFELQEL